MTNLDPRALVRAALIDATDTYPGDVVHTDALARVQAYSLAAIALTLPQGAVDTGETTGAVTPGPSPAEPSLVWECPACHFRGPQALTEPSLVALDLADEVIGELRRWREADRIFPPECAEWWDATQRFRDVIDRIELAR